jgi:hypothetical protein
MPQTNSERDVEPEALALPINNLASDETSNQAKDNPADNAPVSPPRMPTATGSPHESPNANNLGC